MPIEWDDTRSAHALTDKHAAMQCQEVGFDTLLEVALELPTAIAQVDCIPVKLSARIASSVTVTLTRPDGSQPSTQLALLPGDDEHVLVDGAKISHSTERSGWRVSPQNRNSPSGRRRKNETHPWQRPRSDNPRGRLLQSADHRGRQQAIRSP